MSSNDEVRRNVEEAYGKIARGATGGCCGSNAAQANSGCGCGGDSADDLAKGLGYSADQLAAVPEGANLGLSCGNPTALASLKPGEVVVDLGSGGGLDVFIAASKVGPTGKAIGVDMTADMIRKARANADAFSKRTGLNNVEFRLGEIEHLPVADDTADVIISNCVINLSPDKPQVWKDVYRALRPGGRVAVSDMALLRPLPEELRKSVQALVGCIAGAATVDETEEMLIETGFVGIKLESKPAALDTMTDINDPLYKQVLTLLPKGTKPSDFITSLNISATKPIACCHGAPC